ncbi:Uncharacterized protein HKD37_17G048738 [Glycine soja]
MKKAMLFKIDEATKIDIRPQVFVGFRLRKEVATRVWVCGGDNKVGMGSLALPLTLALATRSRPHKSITDFRDELHVVLGYCSNLALPRVFVGGIYVGGADDVHLLHESGELYQLIKRLLRSNQNNTCDSCGGFRFIVCDECNGSHKVII